MRAHSPPTSRRGYLDWLRGLAVLIMIVSHILDSWTRLDQRHIDIYRWSMIVAGMGAPLFLFLAGLSVVLSAESKARRTGSRAVAARLVMNRGLQIFGLAFLFRLQAIVVSWGAWRSFLKVDILNIMGPAIVAAAGLWALARTRPGRLAAFALAAGAVAALTPPVRGAGFLDLLPDPIEAYLRPKAGLTSFMLFPWSGFVFAGAFVGVLLEAAKSDATERRVNVQLALGGLVLGVIAYGASFVPTVYSNSQFWTTSPAYFLIRTSLLIVAVAAAYVWHQRPAAGARWSPLQQLGRTSLFIYWIHIELIYGLVVRPLHKALTLGEAWLGILVFTLVMLVLSIVKERLAAAWTRGRTGPAPDASSPGVVL